MPILLDIVVRFRILGLAALVGGRLRKPREIVARSTQPAICRGNDAPLEATKAWLDSYGHAGPGCKDLSSTRLINIYQTYSPPTFQTISQSQTITSIF